MNVRHSISRTNDELDDPQFLHTVSRVSTGALTDVESGENGRDPGTQQPFTTIHYLVTAAKTCIWTVWRSCNCRQIRA